MDAAIKSYSHFYGYSNKELLQNNVHFHLFNQVTVVINVFTSVRNEDINTSTAITELILKLNTGQQTRETKQEGRKRKTQEEERGHERVIPLAT
jgi:hypothetical protein